MKRILSVFLVFTMICSLAITGTKISTYADSNANLLINGDFENGAEGWTLDNKATVTTDSSVAHGGEKFLNINQNFYTSDYQTISLDANTDYTYSFWYKVSAPSSSVTWNFKISDFESTAVKLSDTEGSWVKVTGEFNSGDKTSTLFWFYNNGEHGNFFIDDCSVTKKTNTEGTKKGNLLVNGGFEDGTTGWILDSKATVSEDASIAHSGKKFFNINQNFYTSNYQAVVLEKNTDYVYSFWYKVSSPSASVDWNFKISEFEETAVKLEDTEGNWAKITGEFNSSDVTNTYFWFYNNGEHGNFFIDDCSLLLKSEVDDTQKKGNLLVNGNFENGTDGWIMDSKATISTDGSSAHSGSSFFNINQNFYSVSYQTVVLEPNTDYVYSFWYKVTNPGSAEWNFGLDGFEATKIKLKDTEGNWMKHTGEFNSSDKNNTLFCFYNNGEHGTFFIDDCELLLKSEAEDEPQETKKTGNLVKNGGFENGFTDWVVDEKVTITENLSEAHGGNKFFNINQNYYSLSYQSVDIDENTDYVFGFWYKSGNPGNADWNVKIGEFEETQVKLYDTQGVWKYYSGTFKSGSVKNVAFCIYNNGEHGDFFIDDCFIISEEEYVEPDISGVSFGGNILINGDFEDGTSGWNLDSKATVTFDNSIAHGGSNFFNINQNFYTMNTQKIELEPNTDYEYSLWYYVSYPAESVEWNFQLSGFENTAFKFEDTHGEWNQLTGTFNSGSATETVFCIYNNGEKGEFFVDDCFVSKIHTDEKIYFDKNATITQHTTTDNSMLVGWEEVTCEDRNITYNLYCSEDQINGKNIQELKAIATTGSMLCEINGLKENTGYWIAVSATDRNGNTAYLRSGKKFYTMKSEDVNALEPIGNNLLKDYSFESGEFFNDQSDDNGTELGVWHNYAGINKDDGTFNATFNTEQAYSGSQCLRLYPWSYMVKQHVKVKMFTDYSISFKSFCYENGLSVMIYGVNSQGWISQIDATQTFDFTRFEKTINTGSNTELMICITNNVSGCHIAFFDDIIMVEVENSDLYVAGEVVKRDEGDNEMTVAWDPVNSTSELSDIKYELFMSKNELTEISLSSLKPIETIMGDEEWYEADVSDIVPLTNYWFAVKVSDMSGNSIYMFSHDGFSIKEPEPESESKKKKKANDSYDHEEEYDDYEVYDEYEDDKDYGSNKKERKGKWVKKTYVTKSKKPVYRTIKVANPLDIYLIIGFIVIGVLGLAAGVFFIIKYLKKKRRSK